jgi:hypothetical protein
LTSSTTDSLAQAYQCRIRSCLLAEHDRLDAERVAERDHAAVGEDATTE